MEMPEPDRRQRFAEARILRLSTANAQAEPHLVPATFAVLGDRVAIAVDHKPKRHSNLKRLRNIQENPAVSLLVDHFDEDWEQLWWVRVDGRARVLENADADELVQALLSKYDQYRERRPSGPVIEIQVSRWSGWVARSD